MVGGLVLETGAFRDPQLHSDSYLPFPSPSQKFEMRLVSNEAFGIFFLLQMNLRRGLEDPSPKQRKFERHYSEYEGTGLISEPY